MERYVKNKATGEIMLSGTEEFTSVESCKHFVTSRGMSLADYEIGSAKPVEVDTMRESALTPTQLWERAIKSSDKFMPRYLEDLITDNPDFNIHEKIKTRYDEKVALRATKP